MKLTQEKNLKILIRKISYDRVTKKTEDTGAYGKER